VAHTRSAMMLDADDGDESMTMTMTMTKEVETDTCDAQQASKQMMRNRMDAWIDGVDNTVIAFLFID